MSSMLLGLALLVAPPTVDAADGTLHTEAAVRGLTTRVGPAADDWQIVVGPASGGRAVVTMTAPDGWVLERQVSLDADDPEARARQLASSVAVVIENYEPRAEDPPPPEPEPEPEPEPPPPRGTVGFIAPGAQLSTGPASRAAFAVGATLAGGLWLARDHVMPMLELGWRRSSVGDLTVDGVNLDGGAIAGGAVLGGKLWLGGGVLLGAIGGFARDTESASAWSAHVAIPAVVQARLGPILTGLYAGPELTLPPLRFLGNADTLRWGHLRAMFGVRVGWLIGSAGRFGFRGTGSV